MDDLLRSGQQSGFCCGIVHAREKDRRKEKSFMQKPACWTNFHLAKMNHCMLLSEAKY